MKNENLIKYIEFSQNLFESLQGKDNYKWFFDSFEKELVNKYYESNNDSQFLSKFNAVSEPDIKRLKSYLNFIDRKAFNFGRVFYKDISDNELKKILIQDFKEMKIALKNDNIYEFGRRLCLQLESIFNYSLSTMEVFKMMDNNQQYYKAVMPNWDNFKGKGFDFYSSFFAFDRQSNLMKPRDLSRISFMQKSTFLSIHFNYKVYTKLLKELYFLRNKGSHRDKMSQQDLEQVEQIISSFDNNYSSYHGILYNIVNGIKNI